MPRTSFTAGDLRERITFLQRLSGKDELGQRTTSDADVCTAWAFREPLVGGQSERSGAEVTVARERFVFRSRTDVQADLRIMWRGATYEIETLQPIGTALEWLEAVCKRAS